MNNMSKQECITLRFLACMKTDGEVLNYTDDQRAMIMVCLEDKGFVTLVDTGDDRIEPRITPEGLAAASKITHIQQRTH